jgi:hypothetical protein
MSEGFGGHSTVTLMALGSCLRLTRTHLPYRYAVTSIYILFKAHTYELWEKQHIGCRVIWWGHIHVQLLYSYNQKLPCEYPPATQQRCSTDIRRYDGSVASCLNGTFRLSSQTRSLLGHSGCGSYTALIEVRGNCYETWQLAEEGGNGHSFFFLLEKREKLQKKLHASDV